MFQICNFMFMIIEHKNFNWKLLFLLLEAMHNRFLVPFNAKRTKLEIQNLFIVMFILAWIMDWKRVRLWIWWIINLPFPGMYAQCYNIESLDSDATNLSLYFFSIILEWSGRGRTRIWKRLISITREPLRNQSRQEHQF